MNIRLSILAGTLSVLSPGLPLMAGNVPRVWPVETLSGKITCCHFSGLNDDIDYVLKARYRRYWSKPKRLSKFNSSRLPEVDLTVPVE